MEKDRNNKYEWLIFVLTFIVLAGHGILFIGFHDTCESITNATTILDYLKCGMHGRVVFMYGAISTFSPVWCCWEYCLLVLMLVLLCRD